MKPEDVYITRDSYCEYVDVWPATTGIRKFRGCVEYGNARYAKYRELHGSTPLTERDCWRFFGFYPEPGTAWLIEYTPTGRIRKPKKIDLAFSN